MREVVPANAIASNGGGKGRVRVFLGISDGANDAPLAEQLRELLHFPTYWKNQSHLDWRIDLQNTAPRNRTPERLIFSVVPSCQAGSPTVR